VVDFDTYVLFLAACLALLIVPGPDMAFVLGTTVNRGRKAGILAILGLESGAMVHLLAAVLGLSALLMASPVAFLVVKSIGSAYLVWIGAKALFDSWEGRRSAAGDGVRDGARPVFLQGVLCCVLNPTVAVFYLAFLPQFTTPDEGNRVWQMVLLGTTLNVMALVFNLVLVHFASAITARLRESPDGARWQLRAMGTVFVGLGLKLAIEGVPR